MKYCPKCLAEYSDETLNFCLEDGESLTDAAASEPPTKILDPDPRASFGNNLEFANSIAVLPFADWSSEPGSQHFCDGLVEDILNALTQIEKLKVASCTASFYFKGKVVTAADVGRKLGVETVLDGSVRRIGDRLRVTAQLVRTADEVQIWSEQYDRTMGENTFDLQDELTHQIVQTVKPILLPQ